MGYSSSSSAIKHGFRRGFPGGKAKVTRPAATLRLDFAVIRSALQMGNGWARWDVATECPFCSQLNVIIPRREGRAIR
jgi:hypothetical protein